MQPAALQTTLEAFAAMERERRDLDRHWLLRLERARYEADRAQRQYDAVEPENRSVARSLEVRWNTALEALEALKGEYAVMQRTDLLPLGDGDRDKVRRLAADLPALWQAATTTMVDRKRLLRLVVTEITLTSHPEQHQATFKVLWCGGAITPQTARPTVPINKRTQACWNGLPSWQSVSRITGWPTVSTLRACEPGPARNGPMHGCIPCESSMASRPDAR